VSRIRTVLAFIVVAFSATATWADAPCTKLLIERSEYPGAYITSVSAVETLDLDLTVAIPWKLATRWKDEHVMEVRVMTPRGNLYQSIDFRFVVEKRGKKSSLFAPGQREPVEAELLPIEGKGQDKFLGVKVRLPVGGTTIMQNSMYGTWAVQVLVDGQTVSCGGSDSSFELGE